MKTTDYNNNEIIQPMEMTFIQWLDKQMQRKGFKKDIELADAAVINRQIISGWRNQGKTPSPESLAKIAVALDIPPEEAYKAAKIKISSATIDEWTQRILTVVAPLPPDEKERIYKHVESIAKYLEERSKKHK